MTKTIAAKWPSASNVHAFTTTIECGHLGLRNTITDQDATSNRQQLIEHAGIPEPLQWLQQTHSNRAAQLPHDGNEPSADASYTNVARTACAVLTADCLPLLISNQQGNEVAAIHAGWRGLLNGVIDNTLLAMQSPASELMVWLGPAIGPCHFELGMEVQHDFIQVNPEYKQAFSSGKAGKCYGNLYQLARICLAKYDIDAIYGGDLCTYDETKQCYSYRRQGENSGRMASIIWFD